MEIKFVIRKEIVNDMAWEEFEIFEKIQDNSYTTGNLRTVIARFMVNDKDEPMDYKTAYSILGKLRVKQIKDIFKKFSEAFKESTVPKENGTNSPSPSIVNQSDSQSQAG